MHRSVLNEFERNVTLTLTLTLSQTLTLTLTLTLSQIITLALILNSDPTPQPNLVGLTAFSDMINTSDSYLRASLL